MASIKVNADDQHLEELAGIVGLIDSNYRLLLDGNLDLHDHLTAVSSLSARSGELAELAAQMSADVTKQVAA